MSRRIIIPILSILLFLPPERAHARFATVEDSPAIVTRHVVKIDVDRDGRFVEEEEKEIKIQNEAGREDIGTWSLVYNSRVSKVEVLLIETISGDRTISVPREDIVDKPVATNLPGFDEYSKITVPVKGVQVGTVVRLRTRKTQKENAFPGHYSRIFMPGTKAASSGFEVTIRSKIPLHTAVNDPDNVLVLTRESDENFEKHEVRLKKVIYRRIVEEQKASFLPKERLTYLQFSTDKTLDGTAAGVVAEYEKTISAPLPDLFDRMSKEFAADKSTFVDRLNALTSSFSQKVRYFGDWRPHNGGYVPRPLAEIASSQYGDCKDMASSVAAILRRAGIRAEIAWIDRGALPPIPLPLATPDAYNHAIVRVAHEGKTYWIDPTNPISFAQGIPADLMGRDALVLENGKLQKDFVPLPPPEAGIIREVGSYDFTSGGDAKISGRLELIGRQASMLTGSGRYVPPETIKFGLLRTISEGRRVVSGTVGEFDMLSPIVSDLSIGYNTEVEGLAIRTSAGLAYGLDHRPMRIFSIVDPARDQGDLFLGPPKVYESVERINGSRLVGDNPGVCSVKSPWVDAWWEAMQDGEDLLISSRITFKRSFLARSETGGPEFTALQKGIRRCYGDYALVFEPNIEDEGEGEGLRVESGSRPPSGESPPPS